MASTKVHPAICGEAANICFKPNGIPMTQLEQVPLAEDEMEALRLVDLLGMQQQEAAKSMNISRQTLANLVKGARHKVVDSLINGKALMTNNIS